MNGRFLSVVVATFLMAGCANGPSGDLSVAAVPDAVTDDVRDAVRTHLRQHLGEDYIVDMSRMSAESLVIARDRGKSVATGRGLPVPDRTFEVVGDVDRAGTECWLVAQGERSAPYSIPPLRLGPVCDVVAPT